MPIILDIGHDSGTGDEWDALQTNGAGSAVSVTSAAALANTPWGLSCTVDGVNGAFARGSISVTTGTDIIRCRFYVDVNSITMANGDAFVLAALSVPTTYLLIARRIDAEGYQLQSLFYDDAVSSTAGSWINIDDSPRLIEFYIRRSEEGQSNASVELLVDRISKDTVSGIDLYDEWPFTLFELGIRSAADVGTTGTIFVDQAKMRDDNIEIGVHRIGSAVGNRSLNMVLGGLPLSLVEINDVTTTPSWGGEPQRSYAINVIPYTSVGSRILTRTFFWEGVKLTSRLDLQTGISYLPYHSNLDDIDRSNFRFTTSFPGLSVSTKDELPFLSADLVTEIMPESELMLGGVPLGRGPLGQLIFVENNININSLTKTETIMIGGNPLTVGIKDSKYYLIVSDENRF